MANEEHLSIIKQGVGVWNEWVRKHDVTPDLGGAILSNTDLRGVNLALANLRKADLRRVDLRDADLLGANLSRANLHGARLEKANLCVVEAEGVDLTQANLSEADLSDARLTRADLSGAKLRGADLNVASLVEASFRGADLTETYFIKTNIDRAVFSHAYIGWTSFTDVDLSVALGLEAVRHRGPSFMDIATIYRSRGRIPELFLRGIGLPDEFITYIDSLMSKPIQFYSCFISYSTMDQDFAERLHADLQGEGVRCWFAPENVQGGRKLHEQIEQAIRHYDKLLLVLSPHSMNSEWVKTEIYHARQDEIRANRRKLFPISLVGFETIRDWTAFDADVGKDMAREVREYFVPDFSNWKNHDAYQKAFDRLLRDLKAASQQATDGSTQASQYENEAA